MPTKSQPVDIIADERIALIGQGLASPPSSWASRALYPGQAGSRNWLAVVHEPGYPLRDPANFGLRANRLAALQGRLLATFVSLGPGDGIPDVELVASLQRSSEPKVAGVSSPRPKYIPVEISRPLLEIAIANLQPYADVPVGLLGDFEEGHPFLADALDRYATRPILFALLGGTVGNLDGGEGPFFAGVRRLMQPGDAFLLDLPLAAPGWSAETEPRLKAAGYTQEFRRFLGEGLRRAGSSSNTEPLETRARAEVAFEEQVAFALRHDAGTGAEVITVTDSHNGRTVLNRRYRWQSILSWFEDHGFAVEFARSSVTSDQDKFGMGVILLTVR